MAVVEGGQEQSQFNSSIAVLVRIDLCLKVVDDSIGKLDYHTMFMWTLALYGELAPVMTAEQRDEHDRYFENALAAFQSIIEKGSNKNKFFVDEFKTIFAWGVELKLFMQEKGMYISKNDPRFAMATR